MSVDLKNALRLSFVAGETELPIPAVSEILARLRSGPVWDVASIAPVDDQFPLLHVEWHEGHGFVLQCYEDEQATIWEGREGREAWERANSGTD